MSDRARRAAAALAVVLTIAVLGGCSAADDPAPQIAELDQEPVATLGVDADGFDPGELELVEGDVVTLVNEGDEPHSFVVDDPFRDTGEMLPGEEVVLRFDEADELVAHDGTEPDHTVTIVVEERPEG